MDKLHGIEVIIARSHAKLLQDIRELIDFQDVEEKVTEEVKVEDMLFVGQVFPFNGGELSIEHIPNVREGAGAQVVCQGMVTVVRDGFEGKKHSTIHLSRERVEACIAEQDGQDEVA